jgi:spermidine synthase
MGLTTIIVEVVVLVWFQSLYGYLYGRIALLLSSFMFGLFAGSWASSRRRGVAISRLSVSGLGVILLLAALLAVMPAGPPAVVPFLFLFLFGALAGDIFIVANRLFLGARRAYGLGYGLELLGSFLGALATSSLLIPLAGLRALLVAVLALNLFGLAFLLTRPRDI